MPGYLGMPLDEDRRRAARDQHGRLYGRARRGPRGRRSRRLHESATLRASRRRRACTCWPRPTACCGARRDCAASRLEAAGLSGARAPGAISTASSAQMQRAGGWPDEFQYRGEVDRAQKIAFLQASTCSRCRRPYAEPKGIVPARGDGRAACRSCSRGAARFTEMIEQNRRRPAREPDDPRARRRVC